jgi:ATP-binding cassette subfamily C protein LapB
MKNDFDVSRIIYEIANHFDVSITAGEARATLADREGDESDLNWATRVLRDIGIESETVEGLGQVDFNRSKDIFALDAKEQIYLIAYDDQAEMVVARELGTNGKKVPLNEFLIFSGSLDAYQLYHFYHAEADSEAFIPGVDAHWFFGPIWRNRRFIYQAAFASLLTNFFAIGTSVFSLIVYNKIIPAQAMSSLAVLVSGMVILIVGDFVIKITRTKFLSIVSDDADQVIADRLFYKILDIKFKDKKGSVGALANTLKEYEQIREFFTSAAMIALIDFPFAILFLAFMGFIGGWMVVPVIVGILILICSAYFFQPQLKKLSESSFEDSQSKHSVLVETLSGLESIKMLGAGGMLRRKFRRVLETQATSNEQIKKHTHAVNNLTQEVQQAVQVAVVATGAVMSTYGLGGFGAIIACTILSSKALMPFAQITQLLLRLNQIRTGYQALNDFMSLRSEHSRSKQYFQRGRLDSHLDFKGVCFKYEGQKGDALNDVSFSVGDKERIAIVGRVGSGKTTVGRLIARLYEPDAGTIQIGGVDISQIDPSEIRENIGYVSQEPWLIAGTLEQNITLGSVNVSMKDFMWACETSGVSEFANKHPDGYKMTIRERGEGLSGGQRQCVAIARALIRKPPLYVFDEPTSAMDARTEKLFLERFKAAELDASLVLITHRTSLLALVDKVVVLDGGKVIGSGPTENFLKARTAKQVAA